jgi:hypothetical protein
MEKWISKSQQGKQIALAVVCIWIGAALAFGFHSQLSSPGMTDGKAGFLLGVLLLVIGIAGFLGQGRQTVVVDPAVQRIIVEDRTWFGTKRRSIGFQEIVEIGIGFLGKRSNYVTMYYLVLKLRNGEEYSLFAPGRFYEGASDRSVVEGWRKRLENYIEQKYG